MKAGFSRRNALLLSAMSLALTACLGGGSDADSSQAQPYGSMAAKEMRALAQDYSGRIVGTAQGDKAAAYLQSRLQAMGYAVQLQPFTFTTKAGVSYSSVNVVATKPGSSGKTVIVGAHYDSSNAYLGASAQGSLMPALQGLDDNASGVGVLLELASRLKNTATADAIQFVSFGAEEMGLRGSAAYLAQMSDADKKATRLMVNMDSLITGDTMYFHAGKVSTAANAKAGAARDLALQLARQYGIQAETNPGLDAAYPAGTGCCSDQETFDAAGIPVLAVEATNWKVGDNDGYQQVADVSLFPALAYLKASGASANTPAGATWHNPVYDNVAYLEAKLPGRVAQRAADFSRILTPLIADVANGKLALQ